MDILIKEGHSPHDVSNYSLGQLFLYIELIAKRYDREAGAGAKEEAGFTKDNSTNFKSYRESVLVGKNKPPLRKR